ncbi:MAG: hypothetical protein HY608_01575 [Planctomycetes bacterium]|nr:hypothetical protein [Planctomycetota bacterium]
MKRLRFLAIAALLAAALAEVVLPRIVHGEGAEGTAGESVHFAFENWPAFGCLYGLASCLAIIVVSKLLGKAWLSRREDYYDR